MAGQYIEPMLDAMRTRLSALPGLCAVCRTQTAPGQAIVAAAGPPGGAADTRSAVVPAVVPAVGASSALCADCLARFAAPRLRCPRCALPVATPVVACGACLAAPPPFGHAVAALDYAFPWDGLIQRFKFGASPELARPLASLLADAVQAARPVAQAAPDIVVPVPLSAARLAERGYNQAWELARHAAARLKLPARAEALVRVIDTPHQAGLDRRERERNLRNAFAPAPRAASWLGGRRVALVDDVMTTGATVREAAAALLRGGAAAVELWVLARTPEPARSD
jgi:ComF family protein